MVAPGALVATALTLVPAAASAATTLTVDQGSSACTDTRTASTTAPFCTIGGAASAAKSGDIVQVLNGTYHEQVTAPSGVSFLAASPATVVDGNQDLGTATWTPATGTAFSTVLASKSTPKQVLYNGSPLTALTGWAFDIPTRTLTVDLGGTDPTGTNIAAQWSNGFSSTGTAGVVIDGFTLRRQVTAGVNLTNTTNTTVQNVTASNAGSNGVLDTGGSGDSIKSVSATSNGSVGIKLLNTTNSSVTGSTATENISHGISVQGGTNADIVGNTSYHNGNHVARVATGIDVEASSAKDSTGATVLTPSTGTVVERNTTYANDDSGIQIYAGSTSAVVRRNVTYDNGDHGIDVEAPSATIVSNTVVGNTTAGINLEAGANSVVSTGGTVRDNIAVDNGLNIGVIPPRSKGNIRVDGASVTGTSIDRDLVFQSDGTSALYVWNDKTYLTADALHADAPAQEARGLVGDPKFVDLAGRKLQLTSTSPAVDAADSDAAGWTDTDQAGSNPVDRLDIKDTGTGHVSYADLGAFELDNPPTVAPSAPQSLVGTGGDGQVDLTWSAPASDGGSSVTGYNIYRGTTAGGEANTPVASNVSPTNFSDTGLTNGATYYYTVTAVNGVGESPHSSEASATPTAKAAAPSAPLSPAATAAGSSVDLTWSAPASDGGSSVTGYNIYRGTTPGGEANTPVASNVSGTSFTDPGLTNGAYYYTVTAVNAVGESPQSSEASATVNVGPPPPPPPPTDNPPTAKITATPGQVTEGGTVTLDASSSTDDNGIAGYTFSCDNGTTAVQDKAAAKCTYATAGTYHPTVTVTDTAGQTDKASATVNVNAAPTPTAALKVSASKVKQLVPVTLDASGSAANGSPITSYQFTCAPQQPKAAQTSPTASCVFRRMGDHAVQVEVTNAAGKTSTATQTVTVLAGQPPTARLTVSRQSLRTGQTVKADAASSSGSTVSPISGYRFQCGTQQVTKWGSKATTGCTFRHSGWRTITVWVKNTLGQVDRRSRQVHVNR